MTNLTLDNALDHNKKPIKVDDKVVPISITENKAFYDKTPSDTNELVNKKYVDDNTGWSIRISGYRANNNYDDRYYTGYYGHSNAWSNYDTNPTSISYTDAYSAMWIAPQAGSLIKMDAILRTTNTDPIQFYAYKGAVPAEGSTGVSLTLIGQSGAITCDSGDSIYSSTTFASDNTFSEGDGIWVFYKKDSTSGNQSSYFTITLSGEYS